MADIRFSPREIIVQAQHFIPLGEQAFAEMGAQKSRAAGD
jgi:hypothetical protein